MNVPAITAVRLGISSGSVSSTGINKKVGEEVVEAEAMEVSSVSKTPTLTPIPLRIIPLGNIKLLWCPQMVKGLSILQMGKKGGKRNIMKRTSIVVRLVAIDLESLCGRLMRVGTKRKTFTPSSRASTPTKWPQKLVPSPNNSKRKKMVSLHAKKQKARPNTNDLARTEKEESDQDGDNRKPAAETSPRRALLPAGLVAGEESNREEEELEDPAVRNHQPDFGLC